MKESLIISFIREHPNNWKDLLINEYKLTINNYNDYHIFSYNIGCDFSNPIVQEARGIIIDINELRVVCKAFDKFFNYQESNSAFTKIKWNDNIRIYDKVDGSIIKLYYDYKYKKDWVFATNGCIYAENANLPFLDKKSFNYLIHNASNYNQINFNFLNKDYTYVFELVSPVNRIVVKYSYDFLFHLTSFNNITLEEDIDLDIGIRRPRRHNIYSFEDCKDIIDSYNRNEHISDIHYEGLVVVDEDYNRIKMKSLKYVEAHHLVNNHNIYKEDIIDILFYKKLTVEELCNMFNKDDEHIIYYYAYQLSKVLYNIDKMIYKTKALYEEYGFDKKALAMSIKDDKYSKFGFNAIKDKPKELELRDILSFIDDFKEEK